MSDLINRKVVMDWLRELQAQTIIHRNKGNNSLVDTTIEVAVNNFINFIVQVPTAYDVDKVVDILEHEAQMLYSLNAFEPVKAWRNDLLIPIVKSGGEKSLKGGLEE